MGNISFLSIIMPALNEEKNIAMAIDNCLKALKDYNIYGEIIVVNDGSTDKTKDVVTDFIIKNNRIRIINHHTPKGVGASFWDGVDNTKGDIVVMIPGDNENDPWEILRYYKLLNHVDIVIPFVFNKEMRSLFRNVLSFIYRFIINTTFLVSLNYTNGTVIYRKSILNEIDHRSAGFFFQTDILIRAVKRGYLFAEVPYKLNFRNAGVSKAVTFPSLWRVINGYIQLVKDIYYNKQGKNLRRHFASDSLTFKRYNQ